MIFRREVTGKFHCKLLLSSEIAKAEAIVFEPGKRKTDEWVYSHLIQINLKQEF